MRYRRAIIEGAICFFSDNLAGRSRRLLVEQAADLREVVRQVRQTHPFDILAWCILPEHLYAVRALPPGDSDLSRSCAAGVVIGGLGMRGTPRW